MNMVLTPYFEEQIKQKVDSGLYNSASEVIHEALQLLDERDYLQNRQKYTSQFFGYVNSVQ